MATKKKTQSVDLSDIEPVWGKVKGDSKWAFILKPDQYGKFSIDLYGGAVEELAEDLQSLYDEGLAEVKKAGKKPLVSRPILKENNEDGKKFVSFKTKDKKPDGSPRVIPVYGPDGKKVEEWSQLIGNGSRVAVKYRAFPYWTPLSGDEGTYGVSLQLIALQVIDLVEYSGGDGFDDETGGEDIEEDNEEF